MDSIKTGIERPGCDALDVLLYRDRLPGTENLLLSTPVGSTVAGLGPPEGIPGVKTSRICGLKSISTHLVDSSQIVLSSDEELGKSSSKVASRQQHHNPAHEVKIV